MRTCGLKNDQTNFGSGLGPPLESSTRSILDPRVHFSRFSGLSKTHAHFQTKARRSCKPNEKMVLVCGCKLPLMFRRFILHSWKLPGPFWKTWFHLQRPSGRFRLLVLPSVQQRLKVAKSGRSMQQLAGDLNLWQELRGPALSFPPSSCRYSAGGRPQRRCPGVFLKDATSAKHRAMCRF